jgi:hypothetical protein
MIKPILNDTRKRRAFELLLIGIICCHFFLPVIQFFGKVYGHKALWFWSSVIVRDLSFAAETMVENILNLLVGIFFNLMYWALGVLLILKLSNKRHVLFEMILALLAFLSASFWFVSDIMEGFKTMYFGFYVAYIPLTFLTYLQINAFITKRRSLKNSQFRIP